MATTVLYAPTAVVRQMLTQEPIGELQLAGVDYSFTRKIRWKNILNWYDAGRFESMPQQLLRMESFEITCERYTENFARYVESFFSAVRGRAFPFTFTSPDDGATYEVRFSEDTLPIEHVNAERRTIILKLEYAGDLDNSVNNGLVYASYPAVETTTT